MELKVGSSSHPSFTRANAASEIVKSNQAILQSLESRRHEIEKIYSCNEAADDLIVIGKVFWTFHDGEARDAGFAARAVMVGSGESVRLKLYQGWTVSDTLEQRRFVVLKIYRIPRS